MLSTRDRRRLMQRMDDQSLVEKAIVARCAAALGVVVLIAAIGAAGPDAGGANARLEVHQPAQTRVAGSADVHRREIFEQRRQRFAGGSSGAPQVETSAGLASAAPK